MIVVGYDPVAGRVFAHRDGEPPSVDVPTDGLTAKQYTSRGILCLELMGEAAVLAFYDPDGSPAAVGLVPSGPGRWAVSPGGV